MSAAIAEEEQFFSL